VTATAGSGDRPPGLRVVLDARPIQDPGRAPATARYLEGLLGAFSEEPLGGESFAFLLQSDLADPTLAFTGLDVVGRRLLPPTRLLRSAQAVHAAAVQRPSLPISMSPNPMSVARFLPPEPLESRIAPAAVIPAISPDGHKAMWTDTDGDKVTLVISKGTLESDGSNFDLESGITQGAIFQKLCLEDDGVVSRRVTAVLLYLAEADR